MRGVYDYDDDEHIEPPDYIDQFFVNKLGCRSTYNRPTNFIITIHNINDNNVYNLLWQMHDNIDDLCKKGVSQNYFNVSRLQRENDFLITLSFITKQELLSYGYGNGNRYGYGYGYDIEPIDIYHSNIIGFAIVSDKSKRTERFDNSLFIDIICSNNELINTHGIRNNIAGGKALLHAVTEYARENGYDDVSLKSLSHVVNYYRKFGFRFLKQGQVVEEPDIKQLAELNKNVKLNTPTEANKLLLIERAFMFAFEVNKRGQPYFNMNLFCENLQNELSLDYLPTKQQAQNTLEKIPPHVQRAQGENGLHDLYFTLIKRGYADLENCTGITRRQFVKYEEISPDNWKKWMICDEGGYQMRKPLLHSRNMEPNINQPIVNCQTRRTRSRSRSQSMSPQKSPPRTRYRSRSRSPPQNSIYGFLGGKNKRKTRKHRR